MIWDSHFSVGSDDPTSAGVWRSGRHGTGRPVCGDPERWVAVWPLLPGVMPEVLDNAFIEKSLNRPGAPGASTESDGLPQG